MGKLKKKNIENWKGWQTVADFWKSKTYKNHKYLSANSF